MKWSIAELDYAFPTLVRYSGWLATLVLIGFCLAGFYVQAAPGFVAAGAMIVYKMVHDAARKPNKVEDDAALQKEEKDENHHER